MKLTKLFIFCFLSLFFSIYVQAQDLVVKGKVYDDNGLSIPGATVLLKGTSKATTSDFDGAFEIKAPKNGVLVVSYIGYASIQQSINGKTSLTFKLKSQSQDLNEVVVKYLKENDMKVNKQVLDLIFSGGFDKDEEELIGQQFV